MLDIPTLGGTLASAQCVNNRGQVIGQSYVTGDVGCPDFCDQHAFLWDHGTLTDLGTLGGSFSIALWLNDEGEAVGLAYTPGDELFHATLWSKGMITDLGTLPGDCFSVANAINSKGQIAGQSISCDQVHTSGPVGQELDLRLKHIDSRKLKSGAIRSGRYQ
jgi:probable HAF family extracellular repeat protein